MNVKSTATINQVEVMNFIGQTVSRLDNVSAKAAKIDVTALSAGVYFVKAYTSEGIRTAKITVNR